MQEIRQQLQKEIQQLTGTMQLQDTDDTILFQQETKKAQTLTQLKKYAIVTESRKLTIQWKK